MPMFRLKVVKDVTSVYTPIEIEAPTLAEAKQIAEEMAHLGQLTVIDTYQTTEVWGEPAEKGE